MAAAYCFRSRERSWDTQPAPFPFKESSAFMSTTKQDGKSSPAARKTPYRSSTIPKKSPERQDAERERSCASPLCTQTDAAARTRIPERTRGKIDCRGRRQKIPKRDTALAKQEIRIWQKAPAVRSMSRTPTQTGKRSSTGMVCFSGTAKRKQGFCLMAEALFFYFGKLIS